jgi:hypothetical protein
VSNLDQARETQLNNIQARAGRTLAELQAHILASGLSKHGEVRAMLMRDFGLGYGDANSLVHFARQSDGQSAAEASGATADDLLDALYAGPRAPLRPIHQQAMQTVQGLGPFEIAPKKGYLSLRRKKQFAMIGPGTKGRLEIGINARDLAGSERLHEQAPGGMCQYKVFLTDAAEADAELAGWLKQAYDSAG